MYFILFPSFVKVNSLEIIPLNNLVKKSASSFLGAMGVTSIILGIIRGIYFSGINSWEALTTPYGRNFTFAILISILMILVGRLYGSNLVVIPWKEESMKKKILLKIYLAGFFLLFCYALLLICMVGMRFGGI
jgi:hypothetical protein